MIPKIRVSVNRECNMNCVYCPRGKVNMENYDLGCDYVMQRSEILDILKVLKKFGLKDVHYTGGEPLLRPDIAELIEETTAMGMAVELNTNGLALSPSVSERLKKAGLKSIKISLDGTSAEEFKNYTRTDAYERVIANIREAAKILPVRLNCVLTKNNIDHAERLVDLSNELGVQKIHFLDLTYYEGDNKDFWNESFVYLTKELMPQLEKRYSGKFEEMNIFGCTFYQMESKPGGTIIVLKEATPSMRSPQICNQCSNYCHEGVFTLRLSAGGFLNICPEKNSLGVEALELQRKGKLEEAAKKFSDIFDSAESVDSFDVFVEKNDLELQSERTKERV